MKRKTVLRSVTASMALLSLTACGIPNLMNAQTAPDTAPNEYPTANVDVATAPDVEPAYYDSGDLYMYTANYSTEAKEGLWMYPDENEDYIQMNTEEYSKIVENIFKDVATSPLSTFSADVDTASYSNLRRWINMGYSVDQIPEGAVRAEEMINYFHYDYKGPEGDDPFGINAQISDCPWNKEHKLLHLGLQTEAIDFSETPDSNIVFLVDVSGSMSDDNKLPLVKESFNLLVDNLTEKDTVSIVTYASGVNVVLDSANGNDKDKIRQAINGLRAGGGTNGAGGIEEAYKIAEKNFIEDGNNRVIIASDGDFNIGKTSESDLSSQIKENAKKGIFLSVPGKKG